MKIKTLVSLKNLLFRLVSLATGPGVSFKYSQVAGSSIEEPEDIKRICSC